MMRGNAEHASSAVAGLFQPNILAHETAQTTWTFDILPPPAMRLTFVPRPLPSRSKKRSRAVADIDGEHSCMQKKKRRLRLFLITSRLSPQFSHPATNIVDRGSSKIAVWAKQKALGRNLLRKAAILNRIQRRAISAREAEEGHGYVLVEQEREQEELELARLEFVHGSVDTYTRPVIAQTPSVPPTAAVRTGGHFVVSGSPAVSPSASRSPSPTPPSSPMKDFQEEGASHYRSPNEAYAYSPPRAQLPRRDYLPLPPSPLGLSNYDAFDADDDFLDPYAHFGDEDEPIPNPFHNDGDDLDAVPFSPSAITTTSSSTVQTVPSQALKTPPQLVYSDFNVLEPDEAVFGDYDQVDEGADAVWPSTLAQDAVPTTIGSTSPDFAALFATADTTSASKRMDSFAASPNFRPTIPRQSVSPNFPPSTVTVSDFVPSASPNFTPSASSTSLSPNFTPSMILPSASPNFTPSPAPPAISPTFPPVYTSPNFAATDAPTTLQRPTSPSKTKNEHHPDVLARRSSDMDQERRRQRNLMFVRFGS